METEIDKNKIEIIDLKEKNHSLNQRIGRYKDVIVKSQETFATMREELDNLRTKSVKPQEKPQKPQKLQEKPQEKLQEKPDEKVIFFQNFIFYPSLLINNYFKKENHQKKYNLRRN